MNAKQIRNATDKQIVVWLAEARNYSKSDGYPEIIRTLETELARREE